MLEQYGTIRQFRSGAHIVWEGDRGEDMYVVRSGKVRIYKGDDHDEVTLAVLGPGDFFGEMALVGGYPRSASARAEGDVTVTVIDRQTFSAFISEPIVFDIMKRMSQRVRELDTKVYESEKADTARRAHLSSIVEQRHWFV